MDKKINLTFLMIVFVVGVAAMTGLSVAGYQADQAIARFSPIQTIAIGGTGQVAGVAIEQTKVIIDRGTGTTLQTTVDVKEGSTALEAVKEATGDFGLTMETAWYGEMGTLLTSVGGLTNGQEDKYWSFYLNGKYGSVAMDKQIIQPGDKIEVRFEKISL